MVYRPASRDGLRDGSRRRPLGGLCVLGLSISVQVQEGIVVVLDYDVSFGAHFLGQHFVVLRKPFL